jgi:hypothetical protein
MERNYIATQALLGEFRNHLRITSTDMDAILEQALEVGIERSEAEIGHVIALSVFKGVQMPFAQTLSLRGPIVEILSVKVDGTVVPAESYTVGPMSLTFADGVEGENVVLDYKAGMEQIPSMIKGAIFLFGGRYFNNPTDTPEERDRTAAANLLRPYRTWGGH